MMKTLLISLLQLFSLCLAAQGLQVSRLRCEHQQAPLGLDTPRPRFSWQIVSDRKNTLQTAYEIRVADSPEALLKSKTLRWQSGRVTSSQSVLVAYGGTPLPSRTRCYWQLRVWDNHGRSSDWSAPAVFETGLLSPADWSAQWIESSLPDDTTAGIAPLLRSSFMLKKAVRSARLYITARGLYEARLNGQKIGEDCLTPGWTSYRNRIQYQMYDLGGQLRQGENVLGVQLASGWYRGPLAWESNRNIYGAQTSVLTQLEITFADGSRQTVVSDDSWRCAPGPIRFAEIYHGEHYDARMEQSGWDQPGFRADGWKPVAVRQEASVPLIATYGPPVRKHESFRPVRIFTTPKGETVADFGQNLVGWVQLSAAGPAGATVTVHHAEVLDKEGNFYTDNLRAARQELKYTFKGQGVETYEPRFTFMGFRYVRIEGFPGELKPEHLLATALYSDMPPSGQFSCSHPLLNQLQHNIQWGQKGNFVDVPTDCPQRDERLGWTGDAQAFSRTAAFNMDAAGFFHKWLLDLAADQTEAGAVPWVIPQVLGKNSHASAGWADAATIIPWNMFMAYGDTAFLALQYESMKKWVGYMESNSQNDLWNTGFHFGDWLFFRPADDNDGRSAVTDKYLIAQAFFIHSTDILHRSAQVLRKTSDAQRYADLLERLKTAFRNEYLTPNGRLVSGTQTAMVLALAFDILPEPLRAPTAEKLVKNIENYCNHLTTGFLGTPHICHVLSRFGYEDVAYKLLMQESYPSWLYPVKMGATTIWERWDGIKPDSSFQNPGMNSFNHYAYGAIGDWMYRNIAGIRESAPGYREMVIAPRPGGGLMQATGRLETPYGPAGCTWEIKDQKISITLDIPANTSARVELPKAAGKITAVEGATVQTAGADAVLTLGSGAYRFDYNWE